MKIILKDIRQAEFAVDLEENDKIIILKQKAAEHYNSELSAIKLIYGGIILVDDKTPADYKLKDNTKVVVYYKPIAAEKPVSPVVPVAPVTPATQVSPSVPSVPPVPSTGNLFEMAEEEAQAEEEEVEDNKHKILAESYMALAETMEQHRTTVIDLLKTNPRMVTLMQEHPEETAEMLNRPNITTEILMEGALVIAQSVIRGSIGGLFGGNANNNNSAVGQLTAEENSDITELCNMLGAARDTVIQCYLLANKNKEEAANMILSMTDN